MKYFVYQQGESTEVTIQLIINDTISENEQASVSISKINLLEIYT
jgi:hypothetical protein